MLKCRLPLTQAGDTIVEVMVVLAVLGFAIGISYSTANRSLLAIRSAQEASQAAELLQSQLESIRSLSVLSTANTPSGVFGQNGLFCVTNSHTVQALSGADPMNYASYPANCVFQPPQLYHIAIQYDQSHNLFTLNAYWDDLQGNGQDSSTLVYKLYNE